LPEDWLDKYSTLLRIGQLKGKHLKISKMHFSLIDSLSDEIDTTAIQYELYEKKQKLLHFREMPQTPLPVAINVKLRDYQAEGYKWLSFLDEFGWGGCLADDMGLGKTLQVLAFLQQQKEQQKEATSLVVVPTTLIFNWQAEIEK